MEQAFLQHVHLPLLPWVKVYRKEPSAFIYDEHSRECTMFHFGIYRHSRTRLVRITWTCSQSDRCSSNVHCQHPPWSPVSIGKPAPKIHQWTIYFCRWGFGWVDRAQCFRSARRFGAVGSSPDYSRVFQDIWLLGILNLSRYSSHYIFSLYLFFSLLIIYFFSPDLFLVFRCNATL